MKLPTLKRKTTACSSTCGAPEDGQIDEKRRNFLRSGAAAVTLQLVPGVTVIAFGGSAAEAAADAGKRWGLLIDVRKVGA